MISKLAAIVAAIGSTTCCPSLFLSVEKVSPAPRPPMPNPEIADRPILAPSYMDNRFLDEAPSAGADEYREYTDNPQDLHGLARALNSLEQLENRFGAPRAKRLEVDPELRRPKTGSSLQPPETSAAEIHGYLTCNHNYECRKITIPCKYLPELKASNPSRERTPWMRSGRVVKIETVGNLEGRYWRVVSRWPEEKEIVQAEEMCIRDLDKVIREKQGQAAELKRYIDDAEGKVDDRQAEQVELEAEIEDLEAARLQIDDKLKEMELDQRALHRELESLAGQGSQDLVSRKQLEKLRIQKDEKENEDRAARRKQAVVEREKIKDELEVKELAFQKQELQRKAILNELAQKKAAKDKMEEEIASLKNDRGKLEKSQDLARRGEPGSGEPAGFVISRDLPLQGQISGDEQTEVRISPLTGTPSLSRTLFTFVHVSDIQIRDRDIRLGNEDLSRRLDWLIEQSFEYDPELEFNNRYLVESLFATVNKEIELGKRCSERSAGGVAPSPGAAPARTDAEAAAKDGAGKAPDAAPARTDAEAAAKDCAGKTAGDTPSFVIHTGDAIDSGVMTELDDFHRFVDRLNVPFYNVIGNHDVLVFGNLMPTRDPHSDEECADVSSIAAAKAGWLRQHRYLLPNKLCVNARIRCPSCDRARVPELVVVGKNNDPITHANARAHFIAAFGHKGGDAGIPRPPGGADISSKSQDEQASGSRPAGQDPRAPVEQGDVGKRERCSKLIQGDPGDPHMSAWRHGFEVDPNSDPGSKDHRGYYAFKWPLEKVDGEQARRTLLSVVLDTEDLKEREAGTGGRIQKKQMAWLNEVLDCAGPRDLVLVFGHDAISAVQTEERTGNPDTEQAAGELDRVLKAHKKNVIAYFFGHDHNHQICRDKRDGKKANVCNGFWEIQTASLLEFPQEARRIKIKSAGEGMAFLEVVSFREQLADTTDERARAIELARAAAQRDWCRSQPSARCSEDGQRVQRADGDDTYARLWFKLPGLDAGDL